MVREARRTVAKINYNVNAMQKENEKAAKGESLVHAKTKVRAATRQTTKATATTEVETEVPSKKPHVAKKKTNARSSITDEDAELGPVQAREDTVPTRKSAMYNASSKKRSAPTAIPNIATEPESGRATKKTALEQLQHNISLNDAAGLRLLARRPTKNTTTAGPISKSLRKPGDEISHPRVAFDPTGQFQMYQDICLTTLGYREIEPARSHPEAIYHALQIAQWLLEEGLEKTLMMVNTSFTGASTIKPDKDARLAVGPGFPDALKALDELRDTNRDYSLLKNYTGVDDPAIQPAFWKMTSQIYGYNAPFSNAPHTEQPLYFSSRGSVSYPGAVDVIKYRKSIPMELAVAVNKLHEKIRHEIRHRSPGECASKPKLKASQTYLDSGLNFIEPRPDLKPKSDLHLHNQVHCVYPLDREKYPDSVNMSIGAYIAHKETILPAMLKTEVMKQLREYLNIDSAGRHKRARMENFMVGETPGRELDLPDNLN